MIEAILALSLVASLIAGGLLASRLRRNRALAFAIIDDFDFCLIIVTDTPGLVICNRLASETLALTPLSLDHRYRIEDSPLLAAICSETSGAACNDHPQHTRSIDIIDAAGRYRRWDRSVSFRQGANGPLPIILLRDRSDLDQMALKLEKSGGMDALTGLATRDIFVDRLEQALELAARNGTITGVLWIEIDAFGPLVERLGWDGARRILADVAMRIASTTRASDTIARIGQSEFAVLLTNLPGAATAQHTARRFLDSVRIPALSASNETFPAVPITGSVGIALAPRDAATAISLLRNAGAACKRAARQGVGQMATYEPRLDEDRSIVDGFVGEMRTGLAQGQFHLVYMPMVDLAARSPIGYEALLRWTHPVRGSVPTDQFVTAAEQSGMIHMLGDFALGTLCADITHSGSSPSFSLNVSVVQLLEGDWPAHLSRTLVEAGISPECLTIEIANSSSIGNLEQLGDICGALHRAGTRVMLDDFGTGRSSLSELDALRLDGIKIDRQLIHDLDDPRSREMVQLLLDYCADRGIEAVAVGIETEAQAALLLEMGCRSGQGFLFGRPTPLAEFAPDAAPRRHSA